MNTENKFLTKGVQAMFLSTFAFSLANVFIKHLSHLPVMEVVFFRCGVGAIFCIAVLHRSKESYLGSNHLMLFLRGFFGTTALVFFFITLQKIPLATAMTIQYLSPIFTSIIAIFLLSEKVKLPQWLFYAIAFSGVLVIQQFDGRVSPFYLAIGIISAFCSGIAYNLVRSLRGREHPITIVLHFQLFGMIAGFISLFFEWKTPVGWDWFYLFLIGIFSQAGQVFLTHALQKEAAAGVAIINYTGLIYAILIGMLVFNESQTGASITGMLLVVLGVLLSVLYSKRLRDRRLVNLFYHRGTENTE